MTKPPEAWTKFKLFKQGHVSPVESVGVIEKISAVQLEAKWIPCSERLPKSKPEDLDYPTVIACCENGEVMTACYYESTKEWGSGECYDRKINPIAWMPLPASYEGE